MKSGSFVCALVVLRIISINGQAQAMIFREKRHWSMCLLSCSFNWASCIMLLNNACKIWGHSTVVYVCAQVFSNHLRHWVWAQLYLQAQDHSSLCLRMCRPKVLERANADEQFLQRKGRSPVCLRMCCLKLLNWVNAFRAMFTDERSLASVSKHVLFQGTWLSECSRAMFTDEMSLASGVPSMCLPKLLEWVNAAEQCLQMKGRSPLCVYSCSFKLRDWRNEARQYLQMKGRSPLCLRICCLKLLD